MIFNKLAMLLPLAAVLLWTPLSAQAACSGGACPITGGSLRLQIGNALPFPIPALGIASEGPVGLINTANTAQGAIFPVAGAQATVGSGPHPRSIRMQPGQLTWGNDPGPAPLINLGLFNFEPALFSVGTQVGAVFPGTLGPATFAAGGRSGPPTVTMCPGAPLPTASFNPGCLGPDTTALGGPTNFSGIMTYTATLAQFGGIARTSIPAPRNVSLALNVLGETAVPCVGCVFGRQLIPPGPSQVIGAGWSAFSLRAPVNNTPGFFIGSVDGSGLVTNTVGPTPMSDPFTGQTTTSLGGPWTTGRISVTVPGQMPPMTFIFTGSDQRNPATGEGTISLVSAGLANRTLTGPSTGRGWLTITVPEPGMMAGLSSGIALLAALSRRRNRRA